MLPIGDRMAEKESSLPMSPPWGRQYLGICFFGGILWVAKLQQSAHRVRGAWEDSELVPISNQMAKKGSSLFIGPMASMMASWGGVWWVLYCEK
jgi:hypothetical protein